MAQNYAFVKSLATLQTGKVLAGIMKADGQTQFKKLMEEVSGPVMLNIKGANYKIAEHAKSGSKSLSRKKSKGVSKGKSPKRSSKRKSSKGSKKAAGMKRSSSKKKQSKGKKSPSKKGQRKGSKKGGRSAKASPGSDTEIQRMKRL